MTISRAPLVVAAAGKRCGDRSSDRKFDFTHYTLMPALKLSDLNRYLAFWIAELRSAIPGATNDVN